MFQVPLAGTGQSSLVTIGTNISSQNASINNLSVTSLSAVNFKTATFSPTQLNTSVLNVSAIILDPNFVFPTLNVQTLTSVEENFGNLSAVNISANQITAENLQPLLIAGDNINISNNVITALNNNLPANADFNQLDVSQINVSQINASNISTGDLQFGQNLTLTNKLLNVNAINSVTAGSSALVTSGAVFSVLSGGNVTDMRSLTNTKLIQGGDVIKPIIPGTTQSIDVNIPAGTSRNIMKVFYTTKFGPDAIFGVVANFAYVVGGHGFDKITSRLEYNSGAGIANIGQGEQIWANEKGGGTRSGVLSPRIGTRRSNAAAGTQVFFQVVIQNDSDDVFTFLNPNACTFHITENLDVDTIGSTSLALGTGILSANGLIGNTLNIQPGSGNGFATIGRSFIGNTAFSNMACLSINGAGGADNYGFGQVANNQTIMNAMPGQYNSFRVGNIEVGAYNNIGLGIRLGLGNLPLFPLHVSGSAFIDGDIFTDEIISNEASITNITSQNLSVLNISASNISATTVNISGTLTINGQSFTTTSLQAGQNIIISNNVISAFVGSGSILNLNSAQIDNDVDIGGSLTVGVTSRFDESLNVGNSLFVGDPGLSEGDVILFSNIVGNNFASKINSSTLELNCSATGTMNAINYFVKNNKALTINASGINAPIINVSVLNASNLSTANLALGQGLETITLFPSQQKLLRLIETPQQAIDRVFAAGFITTKNVTINDFTTTRTLINTVSITSPLINSSVGNFSNINSNNISTPILHATNISSNDLTTNIFTCIDGKATFRFNTPTLNASTGNFLIINSGVGNTSLINSSTINTNNMEVMNNMSVFNNLFVATKIDTNLVIANDGDFIACDATNYTGNRINICTNNASVGNFSTMTVTGVANLNTIQGGTLSLPGGIANTSILNVSLVQSIEVIGTDMDFGTGFVSSFKSQLINASTINASVVNGANLSTASMAIGQGLELNPFQNTLQLTQTPAQAIAELETAGITTTSVNTSGLNVDGLTTLDAVGISLSLQCPTINATTINVSSALNAVNGNFSTISVSNISGFQETISAGTNISILNNVVSTLASPTFSIVRATTSNASTGNFSFLNVNSSVTIGNITGGPAIFGSVQSTGNLRGNNASVNNMSVINTLRATIVNCNDVESLRTFANNICVTNVSVANRISTQDLVVNNNFAFGGGLFFTANTSLNNISNSNLSTQTITAQFSLRTFLINVSVLNVSNVDIQNNFTCKNIFSRPGFALRIPTGNFSTVNASNIPGFQRNLVAGAGITLSGTTISATAASPNPNFSSVTATTGNFSTINASNITGFQKTLIAGNNITIVGNTISSLGEPLPTNPNFSSVTATTGNFSTINASNINASNIKLDDSFVHFRIPLITGGGFDSFKFGAVFLICLKDGGDNECVGKFYYQRNSGHDGAGVVDIVVSSRNSVDDIPHGFCSYQTTRDNGDSITIPHRFKMITGTFSGQEFIALLYEGGDTFPFTECYFDGLLKTTGTNTPFQVIKSADFTSQEDLPIGQTNELSLINKRFVIDTDGAINIGNSLTTPVGNMSTLNVSTITAITSNITNMNSSKLLITTDGQEEAMIVTGGVAKFQEINVSRGFFNTGSEAFFGSDVQAPNDFGGPTRSRINFWSTNASFTIGLRMGINEDNNAFLKLESAFGNVNQYNINISNFSTMDMTNSSTKFHHPVAMPTLNVSTINASTITGFQPLLTAGTNITISGNTISATGGGTLPTNANFSSVNIINNTTPTLEIKNSAGGQGRVIFGNANHGVGRAIGLSTLTDGNDVVLHTAGSGSVGLITGGVERLRINNNGFMTVTNQIRFRAIRSTGAVIFNTAGGTLPYNQTLENVGGGYNNSNFTFTAPITGRYYFFGQFFSNGNNVFRVDFFSGNTRIRRISRELGTGAGGNTTFSASFYHPLNAGQTMRMRLDQGSVLVVGSNFSHFGGYLMG